MSCHLPLRHQALATKLLDFNSKRIISLSLSSEGSQKPRQGCLPACHSLPRSPAPLRRCLRVAWRVPLTPWPWGRRPGAPCWIGVRRLLSELLMSSVCFVLFGSRKGLFLILGAESRDTHTGFRGPGAALSRGQVRGSEQNGPLQLRLSGPVCPGTGFGSGGVGPSVCQA